MSKPNPRFELREISRTSAGSVELDPVAVEEPLEIRLRFSLGGRWITRSIAVTMRTPGEDNELAVGFLCGEGLLTRHSRVTSVGPCNDDPSVQGSQNVIRVAVERPNEEALGRLDRNFYTTSSCGVCGKASIDAIQVPVCTVSQSLRVSRNVITKLPALLRANQAAFDATGGIHGAGVFDATGAARVVREDVGRHNATDKVIGRLFLDGVLPAEDSVLVLSGRASFELVQKALVAGIQAVVAVGAPSTLAIDLAARHGGTLIGFTRASSFNVYCGADRIIA